MLHHTSSLFVLGIKMKKKKNWVIIYVKPNLVTKLKERLLTIDTSNHCCEESVNIIQQVLISCYNWWYDTIVTRISLFGEGKGVKRKFHPSC